MAKTKDPLSESVEKVSNLAKDEVEITHPDQLTVIQDKNKLVGFSGWFFTKKEKNVADDGEHEIRVPSINDKGEYVFVKGAKAICKVIPVILLALGLSIGHAFATVATTDESVLGNDRWSVQNDGDIVPGADSDYDIGASGAEVQRIYADAITINGTNYTSLAAGTDGNWTDQGLIAKKSAASKPIFWLFSCLTFSSLRSFVNSYVNPYTARTVKVPMNAEVNRAENSLRPNRAIGIVVR